MDKYVKNRVVIIPARGGSKRIPRKNIIDFYGKPMLTWPIAQAISSGLFDNIYVSTDDTDIASIAEEAGATIPFMRSDFLSGDNTSTIAVVQDFIQRLAIPEQTEVCCIYPTAVLLTSEALHQAVLSLKKNNADFVMPVCAYVSPLDRSLKLDDSGFIKMCDDAFAESRTQECSHYYYDAGQFYLGTAEAWMKNAGFYERKVASVELSRLQAQDIDTAEDLVLAKLLFGHMHARPVV
jgi:N-acylneuraminate cytidylyltransferase